jgi:hypothetical protein
MERDEVINRGIELYLRSRGVKISHEPSVEKDQPDDPAEK